MCTIETRDEAEGFIIEAIEAGGAATRDEFDVSAIADRLYEIAGGTWDIQHVETDRFWTVVEEGEL